MQYITRFVLCQFMGWPPLFIGSFLSNHVFQVCVGNTYSTIHPQEKMSSIVSCLLPDVSSLLYVDDFRTFPSKSLYVEANKSSLYYTPRNLHRKLYIPLFLWIFVECKNFNQLLQKNSELGFITWCLSTSLI